MADRFDIIDIIFNAVEKARTNLIGYKSNSTDGEDRDHYTIRDNGLESKTFVNKVPVVNINVFIRNYDNGMVNINAMKIACRAIEKSLKDDIRIPEGMYFKAKIAWSLSLGETKKGFDCTNIRLEVITQKN